MGPLKCQQKVEVLRPSNQAVLRSVRLGMVSHQGQGSNERTRHKPIEEFRIIGPEQD